MDVVQHIEIPYSRSVNSKVKEIGCLQCRPRARYRVVSAVRLYERNEFSRARLYRASSSSVQSIEFNAIHRRILPT